ncbi:type I-E CRISPR-associated protein Cse2/CasB [Deinococcus planocerae]|uniref:type I-E CRISPR-associated protein Cse2/CasB n=1 Tax=Deinococcus planocerae TaxID=1737569 RepID=UPI000C7EF321|nr:type I-E CRISPR-associated protein Cse2/CasB [Deinococcus planocerae]
MTSPPAEVPPEARFVQALSRLERGRLAELRRSLGDERPGQSAAWLEGVLLRSGLRLRDEDRSGREALYLLAGLYALIERPHEDEEETEDDGQERAGLSLGALLGRLYLDQGERPSTEKRFLALLDADRDGLAYQLRQAVTLLRAADRKPDWVRLLADVTRWTHPYAGDDVRRTWARDFYRHGTPARSADRPVPDDESEPADPPTPPRPADSADDEGERL